MSKYTDEQILQMHREVESKLGASPFDYTQYFALLPIIGKYADTLRADNELLGPAMGLYNDIAALQQKYAAPMARFQANLPANQAFIAEALPVIQQASKGG